MDSDRFDSDQLGIAYPSTYMPGMVPISVDQVGVMLPGMDEQELVVAGMAQRMRCHHWYMAEISQDQNSLVQFRFSTYQLPGMDESWYGTTWHVSVWGGTFLV